MVRAQRRQDRMKRINEGRSPQRVRVTPRDDVIRRDIRHGVTGVRFPKEGGSVEWPLDQFTKRRLRDGDVKLESAEAQQERHGERHKARRGREPTAASPQTSPQPNN